jgi:thiamine-phosphate pyrophosphorylase
MSSNSLAHDPVWRRRRLADAHLMLLFTPELCVPKDPLALLEAVLASVDVIQVRPKSLASSAPCAARETHDWCVRVLDLVSGRRELDLPVIVDDRIDVAAALRGRGCAGVHVGQDDASPAIARRILGPDALIGLSTHDMRQVAEAGESPVDYLGFGPVHPTATKGYLERLGPEAAWIASEGSVLPVFPIGGIDATNAAELARIGRAAVGSAILCAEDPERAAKEIRSLLLS